MVNDRLADLRRYQDRLETGALEKTAPEPDALIVDIKDEENSISNRMANFHREVQNVQKSMDKIADDMRDLKKAYSRSLQVTSTVQQQDLKRSIKDFISQIGHDLKSTKDVLENMQNQTIEMKRDEDENENAFIRIREQQTAELSRSLLDQMQQFHSLQEEYQREHKERMIRTIQVVNDKVTDEQAAQMVERAKEQNIDPEVLIQKELRLTASQRHTLDAHLDEVQQTHKEILELERGLREVHQMFIDFSTILAEQDEMLDRIDMNVMTATEYVDKGHQNMVDSNQLRKKSRKLMFCIIAILVVAAIVGAIIILIVLGSWKSLLPGS
jgi:syntaxin 1B/2/3